MNLWKKGLGILYPQTCCFCGKVSRESICHACKKQVEYISEPRCKKCGKPIQQEAKEFCCDCEGKDTYYDQGRNLWLHKGMVKKSIYEFKYKNRRIYGIGYAEEMYRLYKEKIRDWNVTCIIPIPLHRNRKRQRGYNQAEIIAKHLGKLMGIKVDTKAVERIQNTKPQKELGPKERRRSLQQAFRIKKGWKCERSVLLIDDIYTTGSTIDCVAKVLKGYGVSKVWFLTISIGQGL